MNQSSMQFRARWGNRPLADNWRRQEAVSGSGNTFENQRAVVQTDELGDRDETEVVAELQLDFTGIPFESHEQDSVEVLIYTKYYQLGNIFQMNLDMPDSAKVYYQKVIDQGVEGSPKASSMYALMDILISEGEIDEAISLANSLIETYPESPLARQSADRLELSVPTFPVGLHAEFELTDSLQHQFTDTMMTSEHADLLLEYSENSRDREQAARYMLDAVEVYIRAERVDTLYEFRQNRWQHVTELAKEHEILEQLMQGERDTITVMDSEIEIPGMENSEYLTINDLQLIYPYNGVYWNRSREILKDLRDLYRETRAAAQAAILLEELEKYPELIRNDQAIEEIPEIHDEHTGI